MCFFGQVQLKCYIRLIQFYLLQKKINYRQNTLDNRLFSKVLAFFSSCFVCGPIYLIVIATIHAKIPTSSRGFHSSNGTFAIYLASPKEESGANQKKLRHLSASSWGAPESFAHIIKLRKCQPKKADSNSKYNNNNNRNYKINTYSNNILSKSVRKRSKPRGPTPSGLPLFFYSALQRDYKNNNKTRPNHT